MAKFWAVFKREYLERVRTKGFIIVTIFGPLLLGAIMIVPNYMAMKTMRSAKLGRIEVIDATGAGFGNLVMQRLTGGPMADTGSITVRTVGANELAAAESLATHAVIQKSIAGYLVLDSATVAGRAARYAGKDASQIGEMGRLETAIRQTIVATRLEKEGLDPRRIDALTNVRFDLSTERITDRGRGGSGLASTILGFAIAFLLYMSLVLYGQNIVRSVIEEKTTRVSEVIVASVSPRTLLAGKVFGVSAVSMTQIVAWLVSGLLLYRLREPIFAKLGMPSTMAFSLPSVSLGIWAAMLALFVLGFLFYSSLFAAAGATVSSDQEAQQASQPITMMLVASIVFLQPILLAPTSPMARVLTWMPFSAPIVMPLRMTVTPIGAGEIVGVLAVLAVSTLAAIWVSARIYRVGLLMYGKKPSFRELGRWIAQS